MKTLQNYLTESLSGINKNFIKEILDGSGRDFLTVDDLTSNDEFEDLIEETSSICVDYLIDASDKNWSDEDTINKLYNNGKLCKELAGLGWGAANPKDGIWSGHTGKDYFWKCFQLNLLGVKTDLCINLVTQVDEEHGTEFFIEFGQFDTKKHKPVSNMMLFCMDINGYDLV